MENRCVGYSRKSRATDAETLENRRGALESLAARHGLTCAEIIEEVESGGSLSRPGLSRLLSLVRAGLVTHLVTLDRARLSRGSAADWEHIEQIFDDARLTLITTEEVIRYGDPNREPLPQQVLDAARAFMRRQFGREVRRANRQRLLENKPRCGPAPYGYVRDKHAPAGYRTTAEYPILCEVLRRLRTESIFAITRDLNERHIPPPSRAKNRKITGEFWHDRAVRRLAVNPFYAGYHCQRAEHFGKRRVLLEQPIYGGQEGVWEHPITLAEHHRLLAKIAAYRTPYHPRTSLLGGLMRCENGRGMVMCGHCYRCDCEKIGQRHRGYAAGRVRLEFWIIHAVNAMLRCLPAEIIHDEAEPADVEGQYREACSRMERKRRAAASMAETADEQRQVYGEELYRSAVEQIRADYEAARAEAMRLQSLLLGPSESDRQSLAAWAQSNTLTYPVPQPEVATVREMIGRLISRIELLPLPEGVNQFKRAPQIVWQDWCRGYAPRHLPPWPKRGQACVKRDPGR